MSDLCGQIINHMRRLPIQITCTVVHSLSLRHLFLLSSRLLTVSTSVQDDMNSGLTDLTVGASSRTLSFDHFINNKSFITPLVLCATPTQVPKASLMQIGEGMNSSYHGVPNTNALASSHASLPQPLCNFANAAQMVPYVNTPQMHVLQQSSPRQPLQLGRVLSAPNTRVQRTEPGRRFIRDSRGKELSIHPTKGLWHTTHKSRFKEIDYYNNKFNVRKTVS